MPQNWRQLHTLLWPEDHHTAFATNLTIRDLIHYVVSLARKAPKLRRRIQVALQFVVARMYAVTNGNEFMRAAGIVFRAHNDNKIYQRMVEARLSYFIESTTPRVDL